jgi:hypothetical protein
LSFSCSQSFSSAVLVDGLVAPAVIVWTDLNSGSCTVSCMSSKSPWLPRVDCSGYLERAGVILFHDRDCFHEALPSDDASPKICLRRGLRVAAAEVARPMPVLHVDHIATSVVAQRKLDVLLKLWM